MNSIETIFEWLLAASLRASVLAVVILGIQFVLRHRLPAAWRHALWLPMLAVLILPVLPEAPFALFPQKTAAPMPVLSEMAVETAAPLVNTATVAPTNSTLTMAADLASALPAAPTPVLEAAPILEAASVIEASPVIEAAPIIAAAPIIQAAPALTSNVNFLAILWLAGAGLVMGAGWIGYHRNMRLIRATATAPDRILQAAIAEAAHEAGLSRAPRTWVSAAVSSPAVTGFLRPLLLLPAGFPAGFNATETRLILLHEFSHLKRLDLPLNWLMCLLQAMHWFNPLLWFAFARMRADRESACDARVLSIDATDRRAEYGGALLKLQCVAPSQALSLGFVGIFEKGSEIKARIREISAHRPGRAAWRLTGACILTLLMAFGVTKGQEAEQDTKSKTVPVDEQLQQADAQLDIRKVGAFGFPQDKATVLCDSEELRVSVCNDKTHIYVQAIIWKDSDAALGFTTHKELPIGDYATIVFDTDANGQATPKLDRTYSVNPWPHAAGLYFAIILGDKRSTTLKDTSQGRGSIRYAETATGKVRVDCIVIPMAELGLEVHAKIRFAYDCYSPKPELSLNSIGYEHEGPNYSHFSLPWDKFHEVRLTDRPVTLDLKSIPDGRDGAKVNREELLRHLDAFKDTDLRRMIEELAAKSEKLEALERKNESLKSDLDAAKKEKDDVADFDKAKHPDIIINIHKDGKIRVEGLELGDKELAARIEPILKKFPNQPIRIRADGEVKYQDVVRVIDLCQRAGAWNLSFATGRPKTALAENGEDALEEAKQPLLVVEAPETWKVNLYGADRKGMEFYSLSSKATPTNKEGDTAQLMLTRHELREVKQIPEQLEAQAKALIEKAKGDKDNKLKTEKYNLEEIAGDTFSGSIVQFEIEGESTQTIFMIGDEEGIWTGQFTGTKERWTEAVSILKKLKKKD